MKFVIPNHEWRAAVIDALAQAEDGDTLSVDDITKQELATRAARRMGKTVYIVVEKYRICWQSKLTGYEGRGEWVADRPTAELAEAQTNCPDVNHWIEEQP